MRGFWWAAIPKKEWPDNPESVAALQKRWHKAYGDRRQQLVFIGTNMDKDGLRRSLDECLIGSDATQQVDFEALRLLRDPFPEWGRA